MNKKNFLKAKRHLAEHYAQIKDLHMRDMFLYDPERFYKFSIKSTDFLLDFSKNRIQQETISLLVKLAEAAELADWREKMFTGGKINHTENRAVLHTALRSRTNNKVLVDGEDVMPKIRQVLGQMHNFSDRVRNGQWLGLDGRPVTDVINIGIGGSDLGPKFVIEALQHYITERINFHFVSNVDDEHLNSVLKNLDPATTLFVVASKTFTTTETITNALSARKWFLARTGDNTAIARHFVAVSTNQQAVREFGIDAANMFELWDWVGGRFSVWSAIGLSIMLAVGNDKFLEFLHGAHSMDQHFQSAPLSENMPVIMALLRYWYGTYFNSASHAVLPYDYLLRSLPDYLQQLDMESNGKSVDRQGRQIDYPSGPIIWGQSGINGQHAFYQLLHQGTRFISTDFIISLRAREGNKSHRDILYANFLAQTEALMRGRNLTETKALLHRQKLNETELDKLAPYMVFGGNHPSNSIVMDEITPFSLGALTALYEHKIFVQGILLNLNSFDQWGVEFGKTLAKTILAQIHESGEPQHDSSTSALIKLYRTTRK